MSVSSARRVICAAGVLTAWTLGTADVALAQKLGEELKYEKEAAADDEPAFLAKFKAQGVWKVRGVPTCLLSST